MCWCTPTVRTPCCGKDECHAIAKVAPEECPWCSKYGHVTVPAKFESGTEPWLAAVDRFLGEIIKSGGANSHTWLVSMARALRRR